MDMVQSKAPDIYIELRKTLADDGVMERPDEYAETGSDDTAMRPVGDTDMGPVDPPIDQHMADDELAGATEKGSVNAPVKVQVVIRTGGQVTDKDEFSSELSSDEDATDESGKEVGEGEQEGQGRKSRGKLAEETEDEKDTGRTRGYKQKGVERIEEVRRKKMEAAKNRALEYLARARKGKQATRQRSQVEVAKRAAKEKECKMTMEDQEQGEQEEQEGQEAEDEVVPVKPKTKRKERGQEQVTAKRQRKEAEEEVVVLVKSKTQQKKQLMAKGRPNVGKGKGKGKGSSSSIHAERPRCQLLEGLVSGFPIAEIPGFSSLHLQDLQNPPLELFQLSPPKVIAALEISLLGSNPDLPPLDYKWVCPEVTVRSEITNISSIIDKCIAIAGLRTKTPS